MKYVTLVLFSVIILPLAAPCAKRSSAGGKWKYAHTKEEVMSIIDGTWISTPTGQVWSKIVISKGHYAHYIAMPSRGKWEPKPAEGQIEITEGRFSNTGSKFVAVFIGGGKIVFDRQNSPYLWNNGEGEYPIEKTTRNPWDD